MPHGLTDEEVSAIRALQEGSLTAPAHDDPVLDYLVSAGLVWIDRLGKPPIPRLTPIGRSYQPD